MVEPKDQQIPHIVIQPRERTSQELQVMAVSHTVGSLLKERVEKAKTLAEFMLYYKGLRSFWRESIDWMWQDGNPSADEIAAFFCPEENLGNMKRDAGIVEDLLPALRALPEHPDQISVAMTRIREGRYITRYGILSRFPKGAFAEDPVFGNVDRDTSVDPDILFYSPDTACSLHAADDLYKLHRSEMIGRRRVATFQTPYRTRSESVALLHEDDYGATEYQLGRVDNQRIKQSAENYILVGLQGAFNNEPYVVRISKFLAKSQPSG